MRERVNHWLVGVLCIIKCYKTKVCVVVGSPHRYTDVTIPIGIVSMYILRI